MNGVKIIKYSDIFLSHFTDDAHTCVSVVKEHCMAYIYSGELELNERGSITKIHKGECIFLRRDNHLSVTKLPKNGEQFKSIFLHFPRMFLRKFFMTMDKKSIPQNVRRREVSVYLMPSERPDIVSLFESITPYFDANISPADELISLKLIEGVYVLLRTDESFYSSLFDFTEPWKIDIMDFMNENYMCDLSLEEIASCTGRSIAAFKRDFRKISLLPPQKWIIRKRLEEAHRKINIEGKKVSDVCFEVGFKNLSHFSTAFKRQFGVSPTGK